jgi:hypothetical protein
LLQRPGPASPGAGREGAGSREAGLAGLGAAYVEHCERAGCAAVEAQRGQLDALLDAGV